MNKTRKVGVKGKCEVKVDGCNITKQGDLVLKLHSDRRKFTPKTSCVKDACNLTLRKFETITVNIEDESYEVIINAEVLDYADNYKLTPSKYNWGTYETTIEYDENKDIMLYYRGEQGKLLRLGIIREVDHLRMYKQLVSRGMFLNDLLPTKIEFDDALDRLERECVNKLNENSAKTYEILGTTNKFNRIRLIQLGRSEPGTKYNKMDDFISL